MSNKVIIVDDEQDFLSFVSTVTEGKGFDVTAINYAPDFLKSEHSDVGIVILDLFMPDIDGIELLRHLTEERTDAAVIFMSGKDKGVLQAAEKLAEQYGVQVLGSLQKPFFIADLEHALEKYRAPDRVKISNGPTFVPCGNDVKTALNEKQFHLVYQPQLAMHNRKLLGVEALIRWEHPIHGAVSPGYFVPIIESDEHAIIQMTDFVFEEAISEVCKWMQLGMNITVSINVSANVLMDLSLPEKLEMLAKEKGVPTKNIVIEVTETALMKDVGKFIDILTRLRMKQFKLSIDDFGTGFSSMQQLVRVPFNELKIDRGFVHPISKDSEKETIAEISILLAHRLGMRTVAEGIETEDDYERLAELGCDIGQGFLIAKPMRSQHLLDWIDIHNKKGD